MKLSTYFPPPVLFSRGTRNTLLLCDQLLKGLTCQKYGWNCLKNMVIEIYTRKVTREFYRYGTAEQ